MRNYWRILAAILGYHAVLLLGVWVFSWPLGVVLAVVWFDAVAASVVMAWDITRAGAPNRGRVISGLLGGVNALILLVLLLAVGVLVDYYLFMFGFTLSPAVLIPLGLVGLRYGIEVWVRRRSPVAEDPSQALQRGWIRVLVTSALLALSGLVPLVAMLASFPFELPRPGGHLLNLETHLRGISADVSFWLGATTVSLLAASHAGFQMWLLYQQTKIRRAQWGWLDKLLGVHHLRSN